MNCAAIPETLFESELFGHRRGAFTGAAEDRVGRFAEASGGTLVLDEIGTIRPGLQAKLLRVLESGEFQVVGESRSRVADVRVIAVTNEDLEARVREGAFRADLFYRLNIFPIRVPPLRERKEDIAPLARHFLARTGRGRAAAGARDAEISPETLEVLVGYDWPGNVRELRNVIERAGILAGAEKLSAALFRRILGPSSAPRAGAPPAPAATAEETLHIRTRVEALERDLIRQALAVSEGRKREAAEMLGIDPRNLAYYIRKHGLGDSRDEDDGA
jgi:transcriptional regulator with GAF, ATPase, and Fis domain